MLMRANKITNCYIGPRISPENFVAEHFFLCLTKGTIHGYDGHKHYVLKSGEYCIVRKNHLARYNKVKDNDEFEKMIVIFDEVFLKQFIQKHEIHFTENYSTEAFIRINRSDLISPFLQSLIPYINNQGKIDQTFADLKRKNYC